jgi:hypothetical protein
VRLLIAAGFLLVLIGCGNLEGPRTGTISPPADVLARWSDFPADQVPRPIVLLNSLLTSQAYSSRDVKLAALCGKFTLGIQPPAEVPKQAVAAWPDGSNATYQAISAGEAYSAMVHSPWNPSDPGCPTAAPIVLSAAQPAVGGFATDRGTARMSAWLFSTAGSTDAFGYPALSPSAFWRAGPTAPSIGDRATVSPNGRVLTFSFPGGPTEGPCAVDYTSVIAESPQAVAVAVESSPGRPLAGPMTCSITSQWRSITVALTNPLGGRVVLDAAGDAVAVCPDALGSTC